MDTVFDKLSIHRKIVHWENYLLDLTPVEKIDGIWYKREDKFAPMGYGGINGTKLRQLIWALNELAFKKGKEGVIHGAVSGSPQHNMTAIVCKHFGLRDVDVVGTTDIKGHPLLLKAHEYGAEFVYSPVGYAKTLQKRASDLQKSRYPNFFHLETNITIDHERSGTANLVEAFHEVGSHQVKNIPDEVETLIVPAGSCNSVTSVLYGLARFPPKGLKTVWLAGIGNYGSKDPDYIRRRLGVIGMATNMNVEDKFSWKLGTTHAVTLGDLFDNDDEDKIEIRTFDVYGGCGNGKCKVCPNGKNFAKYSDTFDKQLIEGINFHPRYENKIITYLNSPEHEHLKKKYWKQDGKTMFWIVGSEATQ